MNVWRDPQKFPYPQKYAVLVLQTIEIGNDVNLPTAFVSIILSSLWHWHY